LNPRREEGVALLLVVAMVAIMTTVTYAFARSSLLDVYASRHRMDQVRARLVAESAVKVAVRALLDDLEPDPDLPERGLDSRYSIWHALGRTTLPVPGEGEVRIAIDDASRKINLNGLASTQTEEQANDAREFLRTALERIIEYMPGRPEEKLYDPTEIAEAILDWIDEDQQTFLGDPEESHYLENDALTPPVDRPVWSLDELAAIPAIDGLLLEYLKLYFTPYPPFSNSTTSGVNPNTAPPHVLSLIYYGTGGNMRLLDEDGVFDILREREDGAVFCARSQEPPCLRVAGVIGRSVENMYPPLSYRSRVFTIRVQARHNEAVACITRVIDRSDALELRTYASSTTC
jgi:type II secretory pathway component PulK